MVSGTNSFKEFMASTLQSAIIGNIEQADSGNTLPLDPQVKATRAPRRQFTKAYKLQFLNSYDACSNASERGALLRREGLYHARISAWRNQLGINADGKKATSNARRTDHMAREIDQLKKKLAQAQAVIDLQKKVSELLGTHILPHDSNEVN